MSRVLVISYDHLKRSRAGPAIRSFELARQLMEAGNGVTLAVPQTPDFADSPVPLAVYDDAVLRQLAASSDVVVVQGWMLERHPLLRDGGRCLVVDLYDPFPLELLVTLAHEPSDYRRREHVDALTALNEQLRRGDFFMCASERQRDFWLGALHDLNRVNPPVYADDPTLRSLVDVVPFGVPSEAPARRGPGPREVIPSIGPDDLLLLWGGGVYNWFDPLTVIRAVAEVRQDLPEVRLLFMATRHPNPHVPEMAMLTEARRLAADLDLAGRHVFFNEAWVPYDERASWLLDADVGVSAHLDHVEARFSFRTRVLDYFWAGLPVISTAGDSLADVVAAKGLGRTPAPGSVSEYASAIRELANRRLRSEIGGRVRAHAQTCTWERAAAPLVRFCGAPKRAPDLLAGPVALPVRLPGPAVREPRGWLRRRRRRVPAPDGDP